MNKKARFLVLMSLLAASLVMTAAAQQKAAETAIDPVCGMTVVKAGAKVTYDYKGTTYYFCCTGCKDSFAKDPEKYLNKQAGAKESPGTPAGAAAGPKMVQGQMMHGPMAGGMKGTMGMMGSCPMMRDDVDVAVENTAAGATIKLTGKTPEAVKAIQEHLAKMKEMKATMKTGTAAKGMSCPASCPMKQK